MEDAAHWPTSIHADLLSDFSSGPDQSHRLGGLTATTCRDCLPGLVAAAVAPIDCAGCAADAERVDYWEMLARFRPEPAGGNSSCRPPGRLTQVPPAAGRIEGGKHLEHRLAGRAQGVRPMAVDATSRAARSSSAASSTAPTGSSPIRARSRAGWAAPAASSARAGQRRRIGWRGRASAGSGLQSKLQSLLPDVDFRRASRRVSIISAAPAQWHTFQVSLVANRFRGTLAAARRQRQ